MRRILINDIGSEMSILKKTDHQDDDSLYSGLQEHELQILKSNLPRGSIKKIAQELDMPYNSVWKVLQGKWNNQKVIETAIKLLEENI